MKTSSLVFVALAVGALFVTSCRQREVMVKSSRSTATTSTASPTATASPAPTP